MSQNGYGSSHFGSREVVVVVAAAAAWWWWWFRFVLHAAKEIQAVQRDVWVRHVLVTNARSLSAVLRSAQSDAHKVHHPKTELKESHRERPEDSVVTKAMRKT